MHAIQVPPRGSVQSPCRIGISLDMDGPTVRVPVGAVGAFERARVFVYGRDVGVHFECVRVWVCVNAWVFEWVCMCVRVLGHRREEGVHFECVSVGLCVRTSVCGACV